MYNRYIPQADGSYCRHRVPEQIQKPNRPPAPQKPTPPESPPPCPERKQAKQEMPHNGNFLQRLLPNGLDTEDLIIILLLLLIAGDCREDQNFALLTLGLYLFM